MRCSRHAQVSAASADGGSCHDAGPLDRLAGAQASVEVDGLIAGELDDVTAGLPGAAVPGLQWAQLALQVPVLAQRRPHRQLVLP